MHYEWVPVWFSLLRKDPKAFAALLERYRERPERRGESRSSLSSEKHILLTFTFIHRFSAAILKEELTGDNVPRQRLSSFAELADLLCPI